MILTVTLNAALDVTYSVPALVEGASHRVDEVHTRAGGKGVNVARVLHDFGYDVLATGLAGGASGDRLRADLDSAGVCHAFGAVAGDSRRTVTVVSEATGEATVLNEPGPVISGPEWQAFLSHFADLVADADLVVCSGSLPPGLPHGAYGQLCEAATAQHAETFLDAQGTDLLAALAAGPALVKPNRDELLATVGGDDLWAGAARLRELGAHSVVASLGANGMLALTPDGAWRATPGAALTGNPTGAGDAAVAALAAGHVEGTDWPERLRRAVAWSAAAVRSPYAGHVDPSIAAHLRADVALKETHDSDIDW